VCAYKWNLVPEDGIKPPTRGFSINHITISFSVSVL
jgi:hypothetical protein